MAGSTCVSTNPTNWPDVPWDQSCTSTTTCGTKHTPSFWTQKRLDSITTQVWGGSAPRNVARWQLNQTYANPQDGTTARLWLASLQQTGLVGGEQSLPAINFDGVQRNNRVDGADHIPPMNWWRMRSIRDESGNEIRVEYSDAECAYGTNLPAPATNGKRCHPVRWTPAGLSELTDWFNKYVVLEVSESDRVNGLEPELTKVEYVGAPAWRHDEEDGLVPEARKTWSQWRGYEKVKVLKGRPTEVRSRTDVTYFRGMDGDKTATANVFKDVKITDSTGVLWKDTDQFAGAVRESITYTADGGTVLARTITDPWLSPETATRVRPWGTTKAYQVQEKKVEQGDTIAGVWRQTATAHTYSTDGTMTEQAELGDLSTTADDRCTTITYARSETAWILDLPATKRTVAKPCGQPPTGRRRSSATSGSTTTTPPRSAPLRARAT